jgi:hypothetical protein
VAALVVLLFGAQHSATQIWWVPKPGGAEPRRYTGSSAPDTVPKCLFVVEGDHGIYSAGAQCRNQAGEESYRGQE